MAASEDRRKSGLGNLHVLDDETLLAIFSYLSPRELIQAQATSPAFYMYCSEEENWRNLCLRYKRGDFHFKGTWKLTTLLKRDTVVDLLDKHKPVHLPGLSSMYLYLKWWRSNMNVTNFTGLEPDEHGPSVAINNQIERRSADSLTVEEFIEKYDKASRPVVITGLIDEWPARKEGRWETQRLRARFGDASFKVSDGSRKYPMKLNEYFHYLSLQHDEDPLYVFDSSFGSREQTKELLNEYSVPKYFPEDLFSVFGDESQRPSFRWFVFGPARSGAPWHVDPTGTSAWNALLVGHKRWLLYPPDTTPPGIYTDPESGEYTTSPSLQWVLEVYPHIKAKVNGTKLQNVQTHEREIAHIQKKKKKANGSTGTNGHARRGKQVPANEEEEEKEEEEDSNDESEQEREEEDSDDELTAPLEGVQQPGEVIFVPAGWWHMVLNLDDTVAVTQNYVGTANFEVALRELFFTERADYWRFREALLANPQLRAQYGPQIEEFEKNAQQFEYSFDDTEYWGPIVRVVMATFLAPGSTITAIDAVQAGQNPVFFVTAATPAGPAKFVVKFYSSEYGGMRSFSCESTALRTLTDLRRHQPHHDIEFPELLAAGMAAEVPGYAEAVAAGAEARQRHKEEKRRRKRATGGAMMNDNAATQRSAADNEQAKKRKLEVADPWRWPYIVMKFVDGTTIQTALYEEQVNDEDMVNLGEFLGKHLSALHAQLPLVAMGRPDVSGHAVSEAEAWSDFTEFLVTQRNELHRHQWRWRTLPTVLMPALDTYVPSAAEIGSLLDKSMPPVVLHGDVIDENVLGRVTANGGTEKWHPCAIIDFGDARLGDRWYDVVSLYISALECDKERLQAFLSEYKVELNVGGAKKTTTLMQIYKTHRAETIRRLMCYSLLHLQDSFRTAFRHHPEARNVTSFEALGEAIWGL